MKIWKYLKPDTIYLDVPFADKDGIFHFVADACLRKGWVQHADSVYDGLRAREAMMSTGIGDGLGFPHTTCAEVEDAAVFLIRPAAPVPYEAIDHLPVDIVLALIVPENNTSLHLQILAGVSRLCREPEFLTAVRQAADAERLWDQIKVIEEKMAFH